MLVLQRKENETIVIYTKDGPITVTINSIKGNRVQVGIIAEPQVKILREELTDDNGN